MKTAPFVILAFCLFFTCPAEGSASPGAYCVSQSPEPYGTPAGVWTWFGGYDETNQVAYNSRDYGEGVAVWTWDAGTTDPLEGWTAVDLTATPETYFRWVRAVDFTNTECPCVPMFPGQTGQIWCGAFETEAIEMGWALGMGYGNRWCLWAQSPRYAIFYDEEVRIGFKYFQDSEAYADFTSVNVLCYSEGELIESYEVDRFSGKSGNYLLPANYLTQVSGAALPPTTDAVALELRFISNAIDSDEDGGYQCECGPFSADDILFEIGGRSQTYNFENGSQGWSFSACPGTGAFMNVCTESEWSMWIVGPPSVWAPYGLIGNALCCATEIPGSPRPGHPGGQHVEMISPIVDPSSFAPEYGRRMVIAQWDAYSYLPINACTFFRPRFRYYPYWNETNPNPRWSPSMGQNVWHYESQTARCQDDMLFDLTHPPDGSPLTGDWEQMRLVIEVACDGESFGLSPEVCYREGETNGAPIFDNVRVGLLYGSGGYGTDPNIALETGHLFHDGFGQLSPYYLDSGDVCNVDVAFDLSRDNTDDNDWLADTAVVHGPPVTLPEQAYWIDLCFKVARKGPRQDWIPGYGAWKARLAADPEADFVCALMDTAMASAGAGLLPVNDGQARVTCFHENDPGFDPGYPDRTPAQEILPDLIFTPGTRIEYYFRSQWALNPQGYATIPPDAPGAGTHEIEFLPMMELDESTGADYDVIWPSVLYVDAFNGGGEGFLVPVFDQLGIAFDKFDRLNFSSNDDASMRRSFGLGRYNPGGWGNNGCTLEQLMGYRLILFSSGTLGIGAGEVGDFALLESWLTTTECGLTDMRRGLIMNGDKLAEIMGDPNEGKARAFFGDVLGGEVIADDYRYFNSDDYDCVWLEPGSTPEFSPSTDITLFGNGYPRFYDYNVLAALSPTVGSLNFVIGAGAGGYPTYPEVSYAQIVREVGAGGVGGYKIVVDGFSFHEVSGLYYGGIECDDDSLAVSAGCGDLFGPELTWMIDNGAQPFDKWHDPCPRTGVDEGGETHLSGPVNYLYHSQPNPFRNSATIRFNMASEGPVKIAIYDVSGRLIKTLHDGKAEAGEHSLTWDGTDNTGNPVNGGIFWMDMTTKTWESSKRVVLLD
ncbi:MAG: FlgD immunoglobulin-like domain containing protein [Candidatus Eisenbacteria bacterium]